MIESIIEILKELVISWLDILILTLINPEIIWITYPIYLTWFATEYFVEKYEGVKINSVLVNGIVFSWVSIDWLRKIYSVGEFDLLRIIISLFFAGLAVSLIILAIKRKKIAKIIGRTGSLAYFNVMFTPIIYGISELSIKNIISIIIMYPLVLLLMYVIDKFTPNLIKDEELESTEFNEELFTTNDKFSLSNDNITNNQNYIYNYNNNIYSYNNQNYYNPYYYYQNYRRYKKY